MFGFSRKIFKSLALVVVFLLVIFFFVKDAPTDMGVDKLDTIKSVIVANKKVRVELALTEAEHQLGLSGRNSLEQTSGMLFVFEKPSKNYFWMKDMNFPIDMIWIDENMRVIYIKKNAQPAKMLETYGPDQNSKYVLEVISGFSDKNNLKVGDTVQFTF